MKNSVVPVLRQPLFWLLLAVGCALIVVAGNLAGHRQLIIGTTAERLYLRDGFYEQETGTLGVFRWMQPSGQIALPHVGPGLVNVQLIMFDAAPTPRALRITLDEREVYGGKTQTGNATWILNLEAVASRDTPLLTIQTDRWSAPGDLRSLGVAITRLEVQAPEAASRARWAEGALLAAVLAMVVAIAMRTGHLVEGAIAGLGVMSFWGTLMAYGDVWLNRSAPAILASGLLGACAIFVMPRRPGAARTRYTAFWGTLALVALLLLLTLGRFNTGDAEGMFQVTAGLAEDGTPWQHKNHEWIKFGLGQPLVTLPLYWLGSGWAGIAHADAAQLTRFCVALLNQVIIPLTALVLFLGARRRYGSRVAFALAGTYLLATPAIAYARLAFAEPLSGLLILSAALLLWSPAPVSDDTGKATGPAKPSILVAGLCLGLAVLVKPANLIYVPVPALYLAWTLNRVRPADLSAGYEYKARLRGLFLVLTGLGFFALGMLPGLAITVAYNLLRYGSPTIFGYEGEGFTTPLLTGLYGLLFSPGKSIFYFAPPVLLALVALALFWRSRIAQLRAEAVFIAIQAVIVLLFHAVWSSWEGNIAWGPRLILPVVPLLLWPLGILARMRWARIGWWLLGAAGLLVAIPGALIDQFYYFDIHGVYKAGTEAEYHMLFSPEWSQIIAHWRFLLTGTREAVIRPTLTQMGLPDSWDTYVPVALVVVAVFAVVWAVESEKREA